MEQAVIVDGEVLNEDGVSGTESEKDEPVGSQIELYSRI